MHVIHATNVNDALTLGLCHLRDQGVPADSRNGQVIVSPVPVTTRYDYPAQRVLINSRRHANPFFHLFESFWMLAGRQDVSFLSQFVKHMAEFSDNGDTFHAPYGHRLRRAFGIDQLDATVRILSKSKMDRRAVLQIWGAQFDLEVLSKDLPCNDLVFLRIHDNELHITVCNRSNDVVWGAYGVNAVQFSVLQEYLAARLGVGIGHYYQISNNFHVYANNDYWQWFMQDHKHGYPVHDNPYMFMNLAATPLFTVEDFSETEKDINTMFNLYDLKNTSQPFEWTSYITGKTFTSWAFTHVAVPMLHAYALHVGGAGREATVRHLGRIPSTLDWFVACETWVNRVWELRHAKENQK